MQNTLVSIFTKEKKDGATRMILSLYRLNKLILAAFQNGIFTQCPASDQTKHIYGINKSERCIQPFSASS